MHSATKYLNGHSDLTAGTVTTRADNEHWQRLRGGARADRRHPRLDGVVAAAARDAHALPAGARRERVGAADRRALRRARRWSPRCSTRDCRRATGHEIAARQMSGGFGGMLSIRVAGGEEAAIAVAANTRLWKRATSLGGVESLIEHRAERRGRGHAGAARPAAPLGRHRARRRPHRRPGAGARSLSYPARMCRNIRVLHNFEPPTTDDEVREAALQFVRKVSGSTHPSRANAAALRAGDRRDRVRHPPDARPARHERPAEEPRGGGGQGRARHEKRMEREVRIRTA